METIAIKMIGELDWDVIVNCMDDGLREEIHSELAPCGELEFLTEYINRHEARFHETFNIN